MELHMNWFSLESHISETLTILDGTISAMYNSPLFDQDTQNALLKYLSQQ